MTKLLSLVEITPNQYEEVVLLWQLTNVGNPARGDTMEAIQRTLQAGGTLILLYYKDLLIGTVWLTHDNRRVYIHHMAVHPEWQGKGYGKMLMKEALNYAKKLGLQAKLEVHSDNSAAIHLYQSFGFQCLEGYQVMIKRDI